MAKEPQLGLTAQARNYRFDRCLPLLSIDALIPTVVATPAHVVNNG
jgi:hypothetical protein